MFKGFKSSLCLGCAITAMFAGSSALAQDAASDTPDIRSAEESGEIVVTARRRSESIVDVPIAVTAYSGEQLEASGAMDITDIGDTTPNVTIEASRATNSTLTAFIRGVGQQDPVGGFEPGVGIYLDDVYLARPQAALLDIYNVERIEVLRGPQGTLYGRNTIGGAIKYVTKRIGADPELSVRGTLGTDEHADIILSAGAPVGDGTLRIGASGARLSRDGFGQNLTTGLDNYNRDIWAGRASAEINNEDNFFLRVQGDYTHDKSAPRGGHRLIPGLVSGTPVLADVYDTRGALNFPEQDIKAWGVSLYAEYQPSDVITLRNITAFRRDRSRGPIDFDALPAVDADVPGVYRNRQFSQELQLLYSADGVDALLGAYFLDARAVTAFDVRLPGGLAAFTFGGVDTKTYAVFGELSYDFSEQLSLSVGGRYTWDKRVSDINRGVYVGGGGSPFFGGTGVLALTQSDFEGQRTFRKFTPKATLSYQPTDDQTLYLSYSAGFKGGGFDPRGVTTACRNPLGTACSPAELFDFMSFDPETVNSYEAGYKASLAGGEGFVGLALFHADYRDVQVPGSIGTVVSGIPTFIGITTNAGKARFQGVELEGRYTLGRDLGAAGDKLGVSGSLGYINADYLRFIDARGIDVADRRKIQNTPEWTLSGTLDYSVPVGAGTLGLNTTLSYRSKTQQFELRIPGLDQKAYALWDASLVWRSDDDRWSLGLHGRNLTDKRYITSGYNFLRQNPDTGDFVLANGQPGLSSTLGAEGVLTGFYGNPRQVYLTVGLKFR